MPRVTVKENGYTREIFVPPSNDKLYDKEIIETEVAKTKDELRKKTPFKKADSHDPEVAGAIKEKMDFDKRKRSGDIKKYY